MRRALALVALVALTGCAAAQESTGRAYDVVLLHGAPYIELSIGGASGLFLADTGANVSGVDRRWVADNDIPHRDLGSSTVGGTTGARVVDRVAFDRLDLGTSYFAGPRFNLQSFAHFAQPAGGRQVGLLGTDFLNLYQFDLDYRARRLVLRLAGERGDPPPGFARIAVDYPLRLPTVDVDVGGLALPCRLDSGGSYIDDEPFLDINVAALEALRASGLALREKGTIGVVGIAGPESLPLLVGRDRPLTVAFGPHRIDGVVLVVHRSGTFSGPAPLALATAALLGRLGRFVLDPFDRVLWVAPSD